MPSRQIVPPCTATGAWDRFRAEVRQGRRGRWEPRDQLFEAAYYDALGLDAYEDRLYALAALWFAESQDILNTL